jgi:putative FmdB family regulatory protein
MPIYTYLCDQCDKTMDVHTNVESRNTITDCDCGGNLDRILYAPSLRFKGSGFYKNDKGK